MSIKLFKGDDSNFADMREITCTLNAPFLDLSGYSAEFTLQGIRQRFTGLTDGGELILVFPHADTRRFTLGECNATLVLSDSNGRRKTLTSQIPFEIHQIADSVEDEETFTIEVTLDNQTVEIEFLSNTIGAEILANKTETIRTDGTADHVKYPTEKAVADTMVAKGAEVYTVTGHTTRRDFDLTRYNLRDLRDLLGTLIDTLQDRGIIQ